MIVRQADTVLFTRSEQRRAHAHADTMACLAMAFAGKEAIFKSFGMSWESGVQFTEIEIGVGESGEPVPVLSGRFAEVASERGVARVLLSLSYDGDYAIGVAAVAGGEAS